MKIYELRPVGLNKQSNETKSLNCFTKRVNYRTSLEKLWYGAFALSSMLLSTTAFYIM